jgi:N-acetyl-gamma-glutamyl-phosphate reductase
MPPKIFIDGQEGTTGLRIHERLAARRDIELLQIDPAQRKDDAARQKLLHAADVAILCLPDGAARQAVSWITNSTTRVIDASTAFRTDPAWTYGLPELNPNQRSAIAAAARVANPGCHATAFLLAIAPLIAAGMIDPKAILTCFSLTGYSGGGKSMIAEYEAPDRPARLFAPRPYALGLKHKHLPEMRVHAGLQNDPMFTPVVGPIHSGMAVETFLPANVFTRPVSGEAVHAALAERYANERFINVIPFPADSALDGSSLDITACNNTNRADLFVFARPDQIAITCRIDNLGKGASGAAIQSLNLMLGVDDQCGLNV